jgi:hypothetical protein
MPTFTATISTTDCRMKLKLNDKNYLIDNGSRTVQLRQGQTYIVQWFVRGAPGGSYTLEIESPQNAAGSITRTLNDGGMDYGGFRFTA